MVLIVVLVLLACPLPAVAAPVVGEGSSELYPDHGNTVSWIQRDGRLAVRHTRVGVTKVYDTPRGCFVDAIGGFQALMRCQTYNTPAVWILVSTQTGAVRQAPAPPSGFQYLGVGLHWLSTARFGRNEDGMDGYLDWHVVNWRTGEVVEGMRNLDAERLPVPDDRSSVRWPRVELRGLQREAEDPNRPRANDLYLVKRSGRRTRLSRCRTGCWQVVVGPTMVAWMEGDRVDTYSLKTRVRRVMRYPEDMALAGGWWWSPHLAVTRYEVVMSIPSPKDSRLPYRIEAARVADLAAPRRR